MGIARPSANRARSSQGVYQIELISHCCCVRCQKVFPLYLLSIKFSHSRFVFLVDSVLACLVPHHSAPSNRSSQLHLVLPIFLVRLLSNRQLEAFSVNLHSKILVACSVQVPLRRPPQGGCLVPQRRRQLLWAREVSVPGQVPLLCLVLLNQGNHQGGYSDHRLLPLRHPALADCSVRVL